MPSLLKFRNGVRVPKSCIIAVAAVNAANELGYDVVMWVTSGNDKVHMPGSKHFTDDALDFQTKHLPTKAKHEWAAAVKKRLGRGYDVILEDEDESNEHLHVEYDPT